MNNKYTIQGTTLTEPTWRALYNIMMSGGSYTGFPPEMFPDFKVGCRSMELEGLLVVSKEDPYLVTWTATEALNEVWNNAEDEIKALLEL